MIISELFHLPCQSLTNIPNSPHFCLFLSKAYKTIQLINKHNFGNYLSFVSYLRANQMPILYIPNQQIPQRISNINKPIQIIITKTFEFTFNIIILIHRSFVLITYIQKIDITCTKPQLENTQTVTTHLELIAFTILNLKKIILGLKKFIIVKFKL